MCAAPNDYPPPAKCMFTVTSGDTLLRNSYLTQTALRKVLRVRIWITLGGQIAGVW